MIDRATFLTGLGSAITVATGGLEPTPTPLPAAGGLRVRVLLGPGDAPRPIDADTFWFGDRRWRGTPAVIALPDGRTAVVSSVDVDAYLAGVLPLEASAGWPAAGLMAQAIVARTYALGRRTLSRPYDLVNGDADQRWGGVDAEHPAATGAIAATRGRILTYANGPASVFYSACCGGYTADAAALWGRASLPYLRGVADPHCAGAPDYRWRRDVPLDRIVAAFGAEGGRCGPLTGFELSDQDGGGRARTVTAVGRDGRAAMPLATLRARLGADVMRSAWVQAVTIDPQASTRVVIEGAGRGHGVGLCQWGARNMARDGADAVAILAFYFPGTTV